MYGSGLDRRLLAPTELPAAGSAFPRPVGLADGGAAGCQLFGHNIQLIAFTWWCGRPTPARSRPQRCRAGIAHCLRAAGDVRAGSMGELGLRRRRGGGQVQEGAGSNQGRERTGQGGSGNGKLPGQRVSPASPVMPGAWRPRHRENYLSGASLRAECAWQWISSDPFACGQAIRVSRGTGYACPLPRANRGVSKAACVNLTASLVRGSFLCKQGCRRAPDIRGYFRCDDQSPPAQCDQSPSHSHYPRPCRSACPASRPARYETLGQKALPSSNENIGSIPATPASAS